MFKVRLPFCLPESRSFQLDQEGHRGEVLGKPARLERHAHNHVLIAEGLEDEEAAKEFLARLKAGLRWFAIDRVLGVLFEESIAELKRVQGNRFNVFGVEFDEPVDGIVEGEARSPPSTCSTRTDSLKFTKSLTSGSSAQVHRKFLRWRAAAQRQLGSPGTRSAQVPHDLQERS